MKAKSKKQFQQQLLIKVKVIEDKKKMIITIRCNEDSLSDN